MSDYNSGQTIIALSANRIEKYSCFLHEFEELNEKGERKFITQLIKIHRISAPIITVMKTIGLISGNSHTGFKINYQTPAEPIIVRRILVALYHYSKISIKAKKSGAKKISKSRKSDDERDQLIKVMNKYANNMIEKEDKTTKEGKMILTKTTPEELTEIKVRKYTKGMPKPVPKFKRKPKKAKLDTVEIRSFGILWYKKIKTESMLKIIICWIPIYHKKMIGLK